MRSRGGGWLGVAVLVALGAFVVPRVPAALRDSAARVAASVARASDTADDALARFRSREYVEALRRVRDAIPRDAAYFLVRAPGEEGNVVFLRFDLAPRRPILLGPEHSGSEARWVVVARLESPGPEVVDAAAYFAAGDDDP